MATQIAYTDGGNAVDVTPQTPLPVAPLRHVTKTVTFDGTAGAGLVGVPIILFDITGRVLVHYWTTYCVLGLSGGGGATLVLGVDVEDTAFSTEWFVNQFQTDDWGYPGDQNAQPGAIGWGFAPLGKVPTSRDVQLLPEFGSTTAGTLAVDMWYEAITADGALVATP